MNRRRFIRAAGLGIGGLWLPSALAQTQKKPPKGLLPAAPMDDGDNIEALDKAMAPIFGKTFAQLTPSKLVKLDMPKYPESGAFVPFELSADVAPARVKALHAFVDSNPIPHVFSMEYNALVFPKVYFATRIRMAGNSMVRAIVETKDGAYLLASARIRVALGSCG
jgi:sulfur-oxidizing protein SoxY